MRDKDLAVVESDTVDPEQFFDVFRRKEHLEPEKALLFAVLEDAIHCYTKYTFARDRVGKERFQEAEHWLMQAENDWIFSFANVCDVVGLNPGYLRRGLRDWKEKTARQRHGTRSQAA